MNVYESTSFWQACDGTEHLPERHENTGTSTNNYTHCECVLKTKKHLNECTLRKKLFTYSQILFIKNHNDFSLWNFRKNIFF